MFAIQDGPLVEAPILDEKVHHEWAASFAAGEPWSVDRATGEPLPYFRAPLYVWFLGGVYRVFGVDPALTPRLLQALMGALACGFLFLLGDRLFGRATAWIAGLGTALNWLLVVYDGTLLIVPLIVLLDVLLVLALVRAAERRDPSRAPLGVGSWALAGLLLGLSAIARPNVLLFAPAAFLWALWTERRTAPDETGADTEARRGRPLAAALALTLATCAVVLPVTVRNRVVGGETVLIASQGGLNFFIGNNPVSDGVTAVVPGTSPDWWEGYEQTHAMVRADLGREPLESEVSQWFFARGAEFWREQPGAAGALLAKKLRYLVNRQEWANNMCLYTFVDEFAPWTGRLPLGFWIVGPLGLLGLALALRDARRLFPLWAFVLVYGASIAAFFVCARFRAPLLPFLTLLGAHATTWLVGRARARDARRLIPALGLLAGLFVFVNWIPERGPFAPPYRVPSDFLATLGNELADRGDTEGALVWLERSATYAAEELSERGAELDPQRAAMLNVIHYSAIFRGAMLLEESGRSQEALGAYRAIVPRVPPQARADLHLRMAAIHEAAGRSAKAAEQRAKAEQVRRALGGG